MTVEQDELLRRLVSGQLGPWAGQGFVPGGITILRPGTWQWETITVVPGSADLTQSVLGEEVDPGELEESDPVQGLETLVGLTTQVGPTGMGRPLAQVIPAGAYSYLDFVRTELGTIRMTVGISNGVSGPLSPIQMGSSNTEVDRDGNLWLPKVRFGK